MLLPPTPTWGGYVTKKYTYFRKKRTAGFGGDTFNSYPYPSSTAAMFFLLFIRVSCYSEINQPRLFLAEVYHLSQQFSTDPL